MDIRTHLGIDRVLCGEPVEVGEGRAVVELATTKQMAADERGLVHGGFVFGLADYAAMLAVNHPNVVLASAESRFLAPVVAGERVRAEARVVETNGKRSQVDVEVRRGDTAVFSGSFKCVSLPAHVLDR